MNYEHVFELRKLFVKFWHIASWMLAVGLTLLFAYCLFSERGMSSGEVISLGMWLWYGGMAGVIILQILILCTLGKDLDSAYVKNTYPEIWKKLFPTKIIWNSLFILIFCLGKYGRNNDPRLQEIRLTWRHELYVFTLPFILSTYASLSFFLWQLTGIIHIK
ncbi:hypothetical protein [uncultured Pseudodesulfovibrio sp.]|uniref:hypothetical protein n=1 Tax=uncultured Pseudodesulfovibrio sp. TaxID=2035858 RepID=UPI0029C8FC6F|nr:hypothetical protein [uncultured Pseudodesulfovibrio sp.]